MRRLLCALALTLLACGKTDTTPTPDDGGTIPDGDVKPVPLADGGDGGDGGPITFQSASKIDLLLAIDNSASMSDKQAILAQAVPDLLQRLVAPSCIDANGQVVGQSAGGKCAQGALEFPPVTDIHVGIVSSSLGGRGGDVCDGTDPVPAGQTRHDDDKGHLLNRAGADELPLADAAPSNFVAWSPVGGAPALITDVQSLVSGVHEFGCGIEAQLESWYRFLVQPDPYGQIIPDPANASKRVLDGVDATILQQRHDFLRPDSLVAVVLISDEDDSAIDPRAVGSQGWAYVEKRFPGSVGGGAARGTSACDSPSTIGTAACTSCGFPGHASDPNCQMPGDIDSTTNQPQLGYYPASQDTLNTRSVQMKRRYGVDPQFPIKRYVDGLSSPTVPDRTGEVYDGVGSDGQPNNSYNARHDCTNPLFAANLPTSGTQELCALSKGPRTSDLVVFTAITGVPWQLLTDNPQDPASPFKAELTADDWTKIVGNNPDVYDYTGQDPHMVQSIAPRAGLPAPTAGDTTDPMNGREWNTQGFDLQYACTFTLPTPKNCKDPSFQGACDCSIGSPQPPLCAPNPADGNNPTLQIRGKAYPGIRQLTLARDLRTQGLVGSLCPRTLDTTSPDYGYRPAFRALVDRFRKNLAK